jgi:hypothetical protein
MCQIIAITEELLGYGNKKDKPCEMDLPLLKNDITTF